MASRLSRAACSPISGSAPAPNPSDSLADHDLRMGVAVLQGLPVCIHTNELHAMDPLFNHAVDGVSASPANPNDFDSGSLRLDDFRHLVIHSPCDKRFI